MRDEQSNQRSLMQVFREAAIQGASVITGRPIVSGAGLQRMAHANDGKPVWSTPTDPGRCQPHLYQLHPVT